MRLRSAPEDLATPLRCSLQLHVRVFSRLIEYRAAKMTSPLGRQCQKALYDISIRHAVGLYWVPGHAGVRGNEIADKLARDGSVQRFVGPEPFSGSVGRI